MFRKITLLDTYTDICTHTDSLRLWILLEERKWLKRIQEAPQEWNLILPRLRRQDSDCYSTKQGSYWSLGPRSPSGHMPAIGYLILGLLSQMQPSFNCIDLESSSLAVSIAGILTGQRLSTKCPLYTEPLPPLATHSSHLHSPSCVGSDGPVFIGCPVLKLSPYWLPLR